MRLKMVMSATPPPTEVEVSSPGGITPEQMAVRRAAPANADGEGEFFKSVAPRTVDMIEADFGAGGNARSNGNLVLQFQRQAESAVGVGGATAGLAGVGLIHVHMPLFRVKIGMAGTGGGNGGNEFFAVRALGELADSGGDGGGFVRACAGFGLIIVVGLRGCRASGIGHRGLETADFKNEGIGAAAVSDKVGFHFQRKSGRAWASATLSALGLSGVGTTDTSIVAVERCTDCVPSAA